MVLKQKNEVLVGLSKLYFFISFLLHRAVPPEVCVCGGGGGGGGEGGG